MEWPVISRAWRTLRRPWVALHRVQIVLDIEPATLHASAWHDGEPIWELRAERDPAEPLRESLTALLVRVPRTRAWRFAPALLVRVGPEIVQVKRLDGLPELRDLALLSAVVREGATRFFLGDPAGLVTSAVARHGEDELWAAAFRRSAVASIAEAAKDAALPLTGIVPRSAPEFTAPLGAVGERIGISRRRASVAIAAAVIAFAAAAFAPGISATHRAAEARAELATLYRESGTALAEIDALRNVSALLDEYAHIASHRRSTLDFLAQLTAALPQGTAVVMVRLDSLGGAIVALGPQAALVVSRLDSVPSVQAPEIVGPVTREIVAGTELERATVRFVLARRASQ